MNKPPINNNHVAKGCVEFTEEEIRMNKPIKVFYSQLSKRFYASSAYKKKGGHYEITGAKFDVTDDIAHAINQNGLTFSPIPVLEFEGEKLELTTTA